MRDAEQILLEWLGEEGIAAALRHSLNRASLVRLANARRVSIPGMRNQSVPMDRLASALASKFATEKTSRRTLISALDTANRKLVEEWRGLSDDDASSRLLDYRTTGPAAARLLYVMARERRNGSDRSRADALLARYQDSRKEADSAETASEGLATARRERDQVAGKLVSVEDGLRKSRDREKELNRELSQRRFDLNNFRLKVNRDKHEQERLEKQVAVLQKQLEDSTKRQNDTVQKSLEPRLADLREQGGKTLAALDKIGKRLSRDDQASTKIAATGKSLQEIRRDVAASLAEVREDREKIATALGGLAQAVGSLREELAALRAGATPKRAPAPKKKSSTSRTREPGERVGLFVDVQNVFYGGRQQNARLDFEVLLETVTRGRRLIRASAYVVETPEINQAGFISLIQQVGYEVKRKDLKVRADGSTKGDWDMDIALDVLDTAGALDVVVLVTGDGDFTSLVRRLTARNIQVEIYSFPRNTAKELRNAATLFVAIDRRMLIKLPKEAPKEKGGTAASRKRSEKAASS